MIRIVMDGAGDMPPGWAEEYDIQIIPINIHFGEKMFLQGINLSDEEFYRLARLSGMIPTTSQPTPQQFIDFYRKIADPHDTILSLHVTSRLSGTFESAEIAARELVGEYRILPVDSKAGSAAMGFMVKEARLMERAGASADEIVARWKSAREKIQIVLSLDNLEFARKSGRVRTLQAALATLLDVKPIIILEDGILDMADRVRTRKRAIEVVQKKILERVDATKVNLAVVHAMDLQTGQTLMEHVAQVFNIQELIMTTLSIGVAANLGPGTIGIITYPAEGGERKTL